MNDGIFGIGIGIICISAVIYIVKNFDDVKKYIIKIKNKKYLKIIYLCMIILMILGMLLYTIYGIKKIISNIENYNWFKNNQKINEENDKQILNECTFYKNALNKNYENQNFQNPYIPDGFSYVEGEWNSGFVIQDELGNQYVWVPCTNKKEYTDTIEILERKNFSNNPFISKDVCTNIDCENFIISSFENGGFYISRFEIGKMQDQIVSKQGASIIYNITKKEAIEIINQMNKSENIHCELINGYAYDTTLSWLKNTNEVKISQIENKENLLTGRCSYNNIFDFFDNIFEMTSETMYGNVIIRGFLFDENNDDKNIILNEFGYDYDSVGRISIREEDNYYTIDNILGIRTILYK